MKSLLFCGLLALTSCTIPRLGSIELASPLVPNPDGSLSAGLIIRPARKTPSNTPEVIDYTSPDKGPVDVDASLYSTPEPTPGTYYEG